MLEYIPFILAGGILLPHLKPMSELARIHQTFKNIKFCIPQNDDLAYPRYLKKEKDDFKNTYWFELPLGLALTDNITEKLIETLSKTMNRSIEVEDVNGEMVIHIYHFKLPEKYSYQTIEQKEDWSIPIGREYKGLVWHNFDKIPHMTVAGTTRFGKTVLLKHIVSYLTENHSDDAEFYIFDLKGGLEFHRYQQIKTVKKLATDPKQSLALLEHLADKIQDDMDYFKKHYYTNILDTPVKTRKFIIIDEAGELSATKGDPDKKTKDLCQAYLSTIARVAGALGYRMVFCTQYPTADTLPRQIKQNSDAKVSFRLPTGYASEVAIDEYGAEKLELPGRALYKTHETKKVQVPLVSDQQMWDRLRGYEKDDNEEAAEDGSLAQDTIKFE